MGGFNPAEDGFCRCGYNQNSGTGIRIDDNSRFLKANTTAAFLMAAIAVARAIIRAVKGTINMAMRRGNNRPEP